MARKTSAVPLIVFVVFILGAAAFFWSRWESRATWRFGTGGAAPARSTDGGSAAATPPTRVPASPPPRSFGPPATPAHVEPVFALPRAVVSTDESAAFGAFSGRVVSSETGEGIARAELTIDSPRGATAVVTDDRGAFEFRPQIAGLHRVAAVRADGYLPFGPEWGRSPVVLHAVERRAVRDLVIALAPAPDIVGVVRSAAGAPVPGAAVRVLSARAGEAVLFPLPDRFTTDVRGEFRFVAPPESFVEATHPEHGTAGRYLDRGVVAERRLELRFPPPDADAGTSSSVIAGRVWMPDGQPAAGAVVLANSALSAYPRMFGPRDGTSVSTDDTGSFRIEGLEPGTYDVSANLPGTTPARQVDVTAPSSGLELKLGTGGTLRGRVLEEATGAPVPAYVVNVLGTRGPLERFSVAQQRVFDPQGRYVVEGVAPGDYVVQVVAFGFAPGEARVRLADGTASAEQDVILPRGGRIEGRVVSAGTKRPIAGARVAVESVAGADELSPLFHAMTDAQGAFAIDGVSLAGVSVTVTAEGHKGLVVSGVRPGTPTEIELTAAGPDAGSRFEVVGIGAVLRPRGDALVVGEVLPGGGAANAGLVPGDEVVSIDRTPVVDLGFNASIQAIRGPEGSRLVLGVRKGGKEPVIEVEITRKKVG